MAASVNCPTCSNAVKVTIDADGQPSAWCEECEREVNVAQKIPSAPLAVAKVVRRPASPSGDSSPAVPMARSTRQKQTARQRAAASRRNDDDYDDDEPKPGSPMIWILAGVSALLILIGVGVGLFFVLGDDGQQDVAINDVSTDETTPFMPNQPQSNVPNRVKSIFTPRQPKKWVTYPETPNAKEYGFTVKLPEDALKSQTSLYINQQSTPIPILYTAQDETIDYKLAVFDLFNGATVTPEIVNSLSAVGIPSCDNYQPFQVAGHAAFRGTPRPPYSGYCVYLQVGPRVFVFSAKYNPHSGPILTDIDAYINSVTISYDPKTPTPRTQDIFLKKIASIDLFTDAVVSKDHLLTSQTNHRKLTGNYEQQAPPTDQEKNSGRGSKCSLYKLPDLAVQQQVTLAYEAYDPQIHDETITTIEAETIGRVRGTINYYLHTHSTNNIEQSTRVPIPVANLNHGEQTDFLPHYHSATNRVYLVSEYNEKLRSQRGIPFSYRLQSLRQVDMKEGETKNPIYFFGTIHDYKLSPDGKWIYVYIEENNATILKYAPGRNANTPSQEGVVIIDADNWKIVHTVRDDVNNILGIEMCTLGDNSILLAQLLANPASPRNPHIQMQHLHPDGKTEPFQFIFDGELNLFPSYQKRQLLLSSDKQFGILGPLNVFGAIRFKVDFEKHVAQVTDYDKTVSIKEGFVILPDNERVALPDGTIARTASFSDRE